MKKKLFGGMAILAIAAIAAFNVNMNTNSEVSLLTLANVEALASESVGNPVDCYSESEYKSGASYYDCGSCSKVEHKKGKGNKRECTT